MSYRPLNWLMVGVILTYVSAYVGFVLESWWLFAIAAPAGVLKAHALRIAFNEGREAQRDNTRLVDGGDS